MGWFTDDQIEGKSIPRSSAPLGWDEQVFLEICVLLSRTILRLTAEFECTDAWHHSKVAIAMKSHHVANNVENSQVEVFPG